MNPEDHSSMNRELIRARHPELLDLTVGGIGDGLRVETARAGGVTLVVGSDGRELSLHSRFDPEKEAGELIRDLEAESDRIVVFLGMGLGYHVRAALGNLPADTPVAVVEADPDIFRAALGLMDLSGLLGRPGLVPLVGLSPEETARRLARMQIEHGFAGLSLLGHPPSIRARPDYYGDLSGMIKAAASEPLGRRLIYPRLKKDKLNILILNTGYYLNREIFKGAESLGHRARYLPVPDKKMGSGESLRRILETVASFKPDFVLTVNHLGFDAEGILADLFTRMEMPFASWFVDSPTLILGHSRGNASEFCSIFLWDSDYVADVKALGYRSVHYLPLATDETTFKPVMGVPNPLARLSCEVGFVGDSMTRAVRDYKQRVGLPSEVFPLVDRAARDFMSVPDRTPSKSIERVGLMAHFAPEKPAPGKRLDLEGLITWRATQIYRGDLVREMAPLIPAVIGDEGWTDVLGSSGFRYHPTLDYYRDLPWFYPICRVNLNATSMQMKTGLNQRVFDVPACGAFVLSDHRCQMEALFEVGREMACYHTPEEALDLARYYLAHERERTAMAGKARARVLSEHTYRHRLEQLIQRMRRDHQS